MSSTELMKQAEHCGAFSKPQLNHTGLLNAAFCSTSRCFRSSLNADSAASDAKYFCLRAQSVIVSTTRPISCLTERSRSGEPTCPRKYFETTMLVACCDQGFGHLDPALFEDNGALFVADDGIAQFPFDLVERVDAGGREEARKLEAGGGLRLSGCTCWLAACLRVCPTTNYGLSCRQRPPDPSEQRLPACFFLRMATPLPYGAFALS